MAVQYNTSRANLAYISKTPEATLSHGPIPNVGERMSKFAAIPTFLSVGAIVGQHEVPKNA